MSLMYADKYSIFKNNFGPEEKSVKTLAPLTVFSKKSFSRGKKSSTENCTNFSKTRPPFWSKKFCWINQLTQLFHHNDRAVLCRLSRLSWLNLVPKRWPLFTTSQYRLYTLDGIKRGVRCTLLIRLFYYIQEYSSWLMNRTFFGIAFIACWSSWELQYFIHGQDCHRHVSHIKIFKNR